MGRSHGNPILKTSRVPQYSNCTRRTPRERYLYNYSNSSTRMDTGVIPRVTLHYCNDTPSAVNMLMRYFFLNSIILFLFRHQDTFIQVKYLYIDRYHSRNFASNSKIRLKRSGISERLRLKTQQRVLTERTPVRILDGEGPKGAILIFTT
jgi:hypothetical protein